MCGAIVLPATVVLLAGMDFRYLAAYAALLVIAAALAMLSRSPRGRLLAVVLVVISLVGAAGMVLLVQESFLPFDDGTHRTTLEVDCSSARQNTFRITRVTSTLASDEPGAPVTAEEKDERVVTGRHRGLFVSEVALYEPEPDAGEVTVTLRHLPRDAFLEALGSTGVTEARYLGEMTVSWKQSGLGEGAAFAYLPGFARIRPLRDWIAGSADPTSLGWVALSILLANGLTLPFLFKRLSGLSKRVRDKFRRTEPDPGADD